MADTQEIVRLMLHAAQLLAEADPAPAHTAWIADTHTTSVREERAGNLRAVVAAMALAEATLRVVAAGLSEKPTSVQPLAAMLRDRHSYDQWAALSDDRAALSDTELHSVALFLSETAPID